MNQIQIKVWASLLIFFLSIHTKAQYKYEKSIYNYPYNISYTENPSNKMAIKGEGRFIYIYEKTPVKDSLSIRVLKLDIEKEQLTDSFYLPKIPESFFMKDIIPGNDAEHTFIVGGMGVYSFSGNKSEIDTGSYPYTKQYRGIKNIAKINDSLALIFENYCFHPTDGPCGLHLHIYNTYTQSFQRSKIIKFPCVSCGSISTVWATATKKNIYAFAGMSDRVFKYDLNLDLVTEYSIGIFDSLEVRKGKQYERESDSIMYGEWVEMKNYIELRKKDTSDKNWSLSSSVFSKDFVVDAIAKVRGNYTFFTKLIKFSPNEALLMISRPGYEYDFVDVYWYNLEENKISRKIEKWSMKRWDSLERLEDYFALFLTSDPPWAPYFYKGKFYSISRYDPALFEKGTKEHLEEKLFKYTKENGYKWQISRYSLKQ